MTQTTNLKRRTPRAFTPVKGKGAALLAPAGRPLTGVLARGTRKLARKEKILSWASTAWHKEKTDINK